VTLAVLLAAGVCYALLSSTVVPALQTIQHDLHASTTAVTWLFTGYLVSASVGTAIIGRFGDMFGKERVLLWTLLLLIAGTLLAAVSQSLPQLIVARLIQGLAGGIFPLSFGIIRDELPRERVAGSIGFVSAIIGIGGGLGIVVGGLVVEHLGWHWLFWLPLVVLALTAVATWRFVPESPVRAPGRVNWTATALMSISISTVLIGISEATTWGWGSTKTLGLLGGGLALCAAWVAVETRSEVPLIDMTMMRIRGVWTTNVAAFLFGGGLYASFFSFTLFAEQPKSTGYGFGASIVVTGLYILPTPIFVTLTSSAAGPIAQRFGSRAALIVGSLVSGAAYLLIALAHDHPYDMLISSALMGAGNGLAFSALGNLVVEAVEPHQTGAATGMNSVMRTIGGALGGQLAATLVASHAGANGHPLVGGFNQTFVMATAFMLVCTLAGVLVPRRRRATGAPALVMPAEGTR
jgi:MFS family permease